MRVAPVLVFLAVAGASLPSLAQPPAPQIVRLWPGKAPGEQGAVEPEKETRSQVNPAEIQSVTNVSDPILEVYAPEQGKRTGVGLIIAPGGAYRFLSWSHEGQQVARWFAGQGVTGFVLKYRVPTRASDPGNSLALMDAQRSVSLVRSRAKEWGLDPGKIGFLGFSAGGHLAARLAASGQDRGYPALEELDRFPSRPDFDILIYPGGLTEPQDPARLIPQAAVSAQTPPTFLAVAADDQGCADCTVTYWRALKAAGVKCELHVYTKGGHGFGMRPSAGAAATWPQRAAEWMRALGILPA
jgi:acetyl esterase/lipase